MAERVGFGKIELNGKGKLKLTSHGVTSVIDESAAPRKTLDKGKGREINSNLLTNLKSLAIYAQGPFADSSDQESYNNEITKLKEKFPNEQAEDVWKRTLATLMADGIDMQSIAEALLEGSFQYNLSRKLGDLSTSVKNEEFNKLHEVVSEFWPKHK